MSADQMVNITIRIPSTIFEWLDEHHWDARLSRSAYAAELLTAAVEAESGE